MEEMTSETARWMQEERETTLEVRGLMPQKGKKKEEWRLEPEGEAETPEVTVLWNEAEGVSVNPEGCEPPRADTSKKYKKGKRSAW